MGFFLSENLQNLVKYSEDFGSWSYANLTVLDDVVYSPCSAQTAEYVFASVSSAFLNQSYVGSVENQVYTFSVWATAVNAVSIYMSLFSEGGAGELDVSSHVYPLNPTEWQRIEVSATMPNSSAQTGVGIKIGFDPALAAFSAISLWGGQLTKSASKVAYIPTSTTIVDSGDPVSLELYPEYDYAKEDGKLEYVHRSLDGSRYTYQSGTYERWKFGLMYLTDAERNLMNGWWRDNTPLLYSELDQAAVSSVQLVGRKAPIGKLIKPYSDQWRGVLEVETY